MLGLFFACTVPSTVHKSLRMHPELRFDRAFCIVERVCLYVCGGRMECIRRGIGALIVI